MRDIFKELRNSMGFIFSCLIILLVLPIGFVNLLGMMSSPGFWIIFLLACLAIPLAMNYNKPIEKSGRVIKSADIPQNRKNQFTKAELDEIMQENKQLHIFKLPVHYDMFSLYNFGHPRKDLGFSEYQIQERLKIELLQDRRYIQGLFRPDYAAYDYHVPINLLSKTVQEMLKVERCNRKYLDEHYADELQKLRWAITSVVLEKIFNSNHSVAKVKLKDDMSGYILSYPFGLPSLEYCFESDGEKEKEFINAAIDRLEECKKIARNMSVAEREKSCSEFGCTRLTSYKFRQPMKERTENAD